jgi:hypothetical protein
MATKEAVAEEGKAGVMKNIAAAMKAGVVNRDIIRIIASGWIRRNERRHTMKRAMILPLLILCSAAAADGGTYKWTDDRGVVSFTDNPALIPSRYRGKAVKAEDDSSRDPRVLQELREEVEKPNQDESAMPRAVTTADSEQAAPPAAGRQQEIKGHLGGDQSDPAAQSVNKSLPVTPGRQQEIKGHLGGDQTGSTPPSVNKSLPVTPGRQQEIKGHLGGDQTNPTPPSMTQPKPLPLGVQPKPVPAGMEQPKPIPPGDQPKPMPAGMEQPKPIPPGDQPKSMPAGMEQPTPMK